MDRPVGSIEDEGLTLGDLSVGQIFHSDSYTIDEEQIKSYASQFDPQTFHTDPNAARHTFFGQLVASGWHTAGITMRLLVSSMPISGGLVGAAAELSWPRPTKPGDTLHVETEIIEIKPSRSRPDRGTVRVRCITRNQDGNDVQVMISKIVVPTRSARAAD